MEKNNLITIGSIEKCKELLIDIKENLEPQPECCIYKVPTDLRNINEAAYTPQVISIGPLHYGKEELTAMEKQKIRYKGEFSKRVPKETWDEIVVFLEKHEQRIRNCYEETFKLQPLEFITMILYDAVFIIELFLRDYHDEDDFLVSKPIVRTRIWQDVQLVENQLPYFVLAELYMLAFPSSISNGEGCPSFFLLSYSFLNNNKINGMSTQVEVKHFTDFKRYIMTNMNRPRPEVSRRFIRDLPCAIKLHESGVKFKRAKGECLLDVKFVQRKKRISWLGVHELQIPRINVADETEILIRNVMALEQFYYPHNTLVCNYIQLMDMLIDTEEDVNLLVEAGIISSLVGESARIAKLFNELGRQIYLSRSLYGDIFKSLRAHYDNPWNHTRATLKRVYFNNLWRGTGTVAAIVLLFLTLLQTICSIKSVV